MFTNRALVVENHGGEGRNLLLCSFYRTVQGGTTTCCPEGSPWAPTSHRLPGSTEDLPTLSLLLACLLPPSSALSPSFFLRLSLITFKTFLF